MAVTEERPLLVDPDFLAPARTAELTAALRTAARASEMVVTTPYRTEMAATLAVQEGPAELAASLGEIRERARAALAAFFRLGDGLHLEFTLFTEMRAGDTHPVHADAERPGGDGTWLPNHTAWRHSVALLYLTTCGVDFDGGELVFPELGRRMPPRAGELVGFPSSHAYLHEVPPVTRGVRCTLAMWMTLDPERREAW